MVREVLKRPLLTEKATLQAEKGIYHFEVLPDTNKIEIARAVAHKFGVTVSSVQTAWQKSKHKTQFTRKGVRRGIKAGFKKAIVHLKPGQTIDIFAPVEAKDKGAL
ncbi:MAG: 50S ribosomal protein L23 [Bacteroidota bacterium]|nr:50S ribosomal protein L23 [Bacteroidota bacterium]MDP4234705.1 50S ribosomal protein L23 [Bacteroidota bacterium]MDP4243929.1 50S ribosomal protein L23 [Bacteroidota bacterium]MDP4288849.1 50S ribosomal protein L23 [Bacteroidota bacterium]